VGISHSGLELLAKAGFELLDLITFFTIAGGKEVRAWPVPRGTMMASAAGKVHSQMEKGFIRAEVLSFDELMQVGDWHAARERGVLRFEGRDYEVQDGDVCLIRFTP
jgi:ribosome-binding ATPase YchF (GTP1/OBG family)